MDTRILRYVNRCIHGYMDTWIQGCMNTWIPGYEDMRIHAYMDMRVPQLFAYPHLLVCMYWLILVFLYSHIHVYYALYLSTPSQWACRNRLDWAQETLSKILWQGYVLWVMRCNSLPTEVVDPKMCGILEVMGYGKHGLWGCWLYYALSVPQHPLSVSTSLSLNPSTKFPATKL